VKWGGGGGSGGGGTMLVLYVGAKCFPAPVCDVYATPVTYVMILQLRVYVCVHVELAVRVCHGVPTTKNSNSLMDSVYNYNG
jgi:hypothetical protein